MKQLSPAVRQWFPNNIERTLRMTYHHQSGGIFFSSGLDTGAAHCISRCELDVSSNQFLCAYPNFNYCNDTTCSFQLDRTAPTADCSSILLFSGCKGSFVAQITGCGPHSGTTTVGDQIGGCSSGGNWSPGTYLPHDTVENLACLNFAALHHATSVAGPYSRYHAPNYYGGCDVWTS